MLHQFRLEQERLGRVRHLSRSLIVSDATMTARFSAVWLASNVVCGGTRWIDPFSLGRTSIRPDPPE